MTTRISTWLMCLTFVCIGGMAYGQQRTCDMKMTLLEPEDSITIQPYVTFDIKIKIENLGPDTLFSGDTVFYNLPTQLMFEYSSHVLTQTIPPGQEADLLLESIPNINNNQSPAQTNFCVKIKSDLQDDGPFVDLNNNNNYDCHQVTFMPTTNIDEVAKSKSYFTIAPNPIFNQLNIILKNKNFNTTSITIKSIDGGNIQTIHPEENQSQFHIPVNQLPSGVYFVDLQSNNGHVVQKFIKQ